MLFLFHFKIAPCLQFAFLNFGETSSRQLRDFFFFSVSTLQAPASPAHKAW